MMSVGCGVLFDQPELLLIIGEALNESPSNLTLKLVLSEEARVWSVTVNRGHLATAPTAWFKQHKSRGKADQEQRALSSWALSLNGPRLISRVGRCSVLLSHCPGIVVKSFSVDQAHIVGETLATLHSQRVIDEDRLSLTEALSERRRSALQGLSVLYEQVMAEGSDLSIALERAVELLQTSLLEEPIESSQLDRSGEAGVQRKLYEQKRVACHRDVRREHLLFAPSMGHKQSFDQDQMYLIDWGQSRLDHWSSDWVKLYLEEDSPYIFQEMWARYWVARELLSSDRKNISHLSSTCLTLDMRGQQTRELKILQQQTALHVINTLRWAHRRPDLAIWQRGIRELSLLNKRLSEE
jgi:hypothetical protein